MSGGLRIRPGSFLTPAGYAIRRVSVGGDQLFLRHLRPIYGRSSPRQTCLQRPPRLRLEVTQSPGSTGFQGVRCRADCESALGAF